MQQATSDGLFSKASNSIPNPLAVIEAYNDVADVNVFLANIDIYRNSQRMHGQIAQAGTFVTSAMQGD